MLSAKINRILLAEDDAELREQLLAHLHRLAPSAVVRCTTSVADTCAVLEQWKPVLAVIDFALAGDCFIQRIRSQRQLYCAPFALGITDTAVCEDIALAMRHGFSHVLDKPVDPLRFDQALQQMVSEPAPLESSINRMVSPFIYGDTDQFDLKRMSDAIEQHIFTTASGVVQSKIGLARMLGISRQLVQYHLRKIGQST